MATPLLNIVLEDTKAERVRVAHASAIATLQNARHVVSGVVLPSATLVYVSHGLGRTPSHVTLGTPQGATAAGSITQSTPSGMDTTKQLALTANGYGATVTVTVEVA